KPTGRHRPRRARWRRRRHRRAI
ncbi:uncharacterized protein METZ01_LOCUS308449, partial [marine metagenome]